MKKLLYILGAIVVLLIVVVVAAPFLIPVDTYKGELTKQVRAATGRDLTIGGDIGLSVLPRTQLTVNQVAFANADWADEPRMAQLDSLTVRVDPWALLSGQLKVESFVLTRPVIHLAVNKQGQPNWTFPGMGGQPSQEPAPQEPAPQEPTPQDGGGIGLSDITLEDVRLVDGRVTYTDMATGETQELTAVNLSLALETLDKPFGAEGSVTWNGEALNVTLDTGAPRKLMAGQTTELALKLDSNPIALDFDGTVTNAEPMTLDGAVDLNIPSLKGLAAWAGSPIEAAEGTMETFKLSGRVSAKGQAYAFTADSLQFDKIEGSGKLGVDLAGAKPAVTGELKLAALNLTPYLPAPTEAAEGQPAEGEGGGEQQTPPPQTEWSDEPIDVAALHAANVDFDLSVDSIQARDVKVGKSALSLAIEDGRLQADLKELKLYDGQGNGQVVVDARGDVPQLRNTMKLEGIQAKPLLTDAAGFDRLEGTGAIEMNVATQGRSQKAMVQALDGAGAMTFRDGAIVGMNLAAMVRNVTSAFSEAGGVQKKTDFAELSGTFVIEDGILRNDDLTMLNPLLRITGQGTADIPKRTVDYRVTPKAVASLKGQGSEFEKKGLAVPVIIEGPWHDIAYRPDLESVVKDVLKDPQKVKESATKAIEDIKKGTEGGVGGALDKLKEGAGGDLKGTLDKLTGGGDGDGDAGAQDGGGDTSADADSGDTAQPQDRQQSSPEKQLKDATDKLKGLFE